jgi:uncharacterized protein (TIGR03435 family)
MVMSNAPQRFIGLCFVLSAVAIPAAAQQRIEIVDESKLPRFDVVSVKPGDPKGVPRQIEITPGRLVQTDIPLSNAVSLAFDLPMNRLGRPLPELLTREHFTIEARMPLNTTVTDLKFMLRALLIDRFKLRVHVESREQDAYAVMLARRDGQPGPRLQPSRVDCRARMEAQAQNRPVPPMPEGSKPCAFNVASGTLTMAGWPITTLLQVLSGQVGRPVVDRTGLTGTFDAEMVWAPETSQVGPDQLQPVISDRPSLVTAVQEELGLKFEATKTSVDYLVIDHLEHPSPD